MKSDLVTEVDRRDVTRVIGIVEVKSDRVYELDNRVITRIFDACATALKLELRFKNICTDRCYDEVQADCIPYSCGYGTI